MCFSWCNLDAPGRSWCLLHTCWVSCVCTSRSLLKQVLWWVRKDVGTWGFRVVASRASIMVSSLSDWFCCLSRRLNSLFIFDLSSFPALWVPHWWVTVTLHCVILSDRISRLSLLLFFSTILGPILGPSPRLLVVLWESCQMYGLTAKKWHLCVESPYSSA